MVLSRCTQDSNLDALHMAEMTKAAEEAKKKYLEQHPELEGTTLKHDPLKLIGNTSRTTATHFLSLSPLVDDGL